MCNLQLGCAGAAKQSGGQPGGHLLIGFSSTDGHLDRLEYLARRYGWRLVKLAESKIPTSQASGLTQEFFSLELFEAIGL